MLKIKSNILNIYIWQFLSVIFNLGSLFIIVPKISSIQNIYGIYSLCLTTLLFFSYADLGFISAGYKYASEFFIKGDIKSEQEVTGFSLFVLLVFAFCYSVVILVFASNPEYIIKGLIDKEEISVARSLFFILAITSPVLVFQRFLQLIFGIRLKDFYFHKVSLFANIVKIISVFYFFRDGKYEIVSYFAFTQILNLIVVIIGSIIASKLFNYSLIQLIRNIRFSKKCFKLTKHLAISTFFLNISWILYYEIDTFSISKLLGASQVGIFAIGVSLLTLFRNFFSIIYTPFNAKFNHYRGLNDEQGLRNLILKLIVIFMPLFVLSIVSVDIFLKEFIIGWVGSTYEKSIGSARLMIYCNLLGFISYPASILLITLEKTKKLYYLSLTVPIVYWLGISLTLADFGIMSFSGFKLIVFMGMGIFYLHFLLGYLNITFVSFVQKYVAPIVLPILMTMCISLLIKEFIPEGHKGTKDLIIAIFSILSCSVAGGIVYYFCSKPFRSYLVSFKNIGSV